MNVRHLTPQVLPVLGALFVVLHLANGAAAQHDYKPSSQLIFAGKFDNAVEVLQGKLKKQADDCEWHYQLAIAQAQRGEYDAAEAALKEALRLGVAPGRAAADAHYLLAPLRQRPYFQKLLASQRYLPTQGPMVGHVTDTAASIWLRTAEPAEVRVVVTPANGSKPDSPQTASAQTSADSDYTAVVRVGGLQPGRRYRYTLDIDGRAVTLDQETEFCTAPTPGSPLQFSLAFGGGAGYVTEHEHMWDTIRNEKPDLLLMLGDNMYSDAPKSTPTQRYCYYRRQSPPPFRNLVSRTAVYSIWDDHDFGDNDCEGGPEIDKPAWKRPVWEVFRQNWANPGYGQGEQRPGCWYDFQVGDVQFFMLDGRYYRHLKGGTMLGPQQKQWLKERLRASQATFKVICSPVPFEYRTKGDSRDTWNGYHGERTEIFDCLTDHKITGVILMSADRHRSDAWKIKRPGDYALYEFNSSRLTNHHKHPEMKGAIFSYNRTPSFGLVEFDTTKADPTVRYTVINIKGERKHTLELKLSQFK